MNPSMPPKGGSSGDLPSVPYLSTAYTDALTCANACTRDVCTFRYYAPISRHSERPEQQEDVGAGERSDFTAAIIRTGESGNPPGLGPELRAELLSSRWETLVGRKHHLSAHW